MKSSWILILYLVCANPLRASVHEHLASVEKFAEGKRIAGGLMLSGLAVGYGVGAYLASRSEYASTRTTGAIVLGLTAGLFAAGGIPSFFLPADFERLPKRFREEKLSAEEGESILLQLRDQARTHRLISSSIALTLGVAQLITFLATDRSPEYQWLGYSGSVLAGVGGFALFAFEAIPEKQWNLFRAEKWRASLLPAPGGALASLAVYF